MTVSLPQLRAFLTVAEHGNFTRAAERLHMAQPALSQIVRSLEGHLGLRLFDRTTRRVELTDGGREFRDTAAKILQDLDHAIRLAGDLASRRRGRVVVAAPPLLASVLLPQTIVELRRSHPGIETVLLDTTADRIVEAVRKGEAHCGCGTFSTSEDGIERLPIGRDHLMLFCPPGSELSRRRGSVRWKDLANHPLITLTQSSGIRLRVEVGFESAQIPLSPAFEVAQITTAFALAEAGLGMTVLPSYARLAIPQTKLVARPLIEPVLSRDIVVIRRSSRAPEPAVLAFQDVLRRQMRKLATGASVAVDRAPRGRR